MDPLALAAYLDAEWPEVIAEAGIDVARIVAIVEEAYAADPLLADRWAEPLADYYLLRRALRAFTANMDVALGGDSYKLKQQYDNVLAQYQLAEARVIALVAPEPALTVGTWELPYLSGGESA